MPDPPTPEAKSVFVCDCEEWMRSACAGEPFYSEHEGELYCVLHFPGKEKSADFEAALQRKLENKDFHFWGVWFPDPVSFANFSFSTDANFGYAYFSARADFSNATFDTRADFANASFKSDTSFHDASFKASADFSQASFDGYSDFGHASFGALANFINIDFLGHSAFAGTQFQSHVEFEGTSFSFSTSFTYAAFADFVTFEGNELREVFPQNSSLNFQYAKFERPDHLSFHTLTLRPHWFVNVDARKFSFINVSWRWRSINDEVKSLRYEILLQPHRHRLFAIACRHLAVNAKENHRYEEASKFRYMAMDARRLERLLGFAPWRLSWWYWLASGYGERVLRAFVVLIGILLVSAGMYTQVGFARWETKLVSESDVVSAKRDEVGAPLKFSRAMTYSAGVMTLQKPEPRPATTAAQTIVLLETVLGPVQAALLALAIRRKFMR
jgi:hypothetical protein